MGTVVGANLLTDRPAPFPPTIGIEIAGDPAAAAALLDEELSGAGRVCLLVIADGAATHGDHAPGRRDDRAAPFDDGLAAALAGGDPAGLEPSLPADRSRPEGIAGRRRHTVGRCWLALIVGDRPPTAAGPVLPGQPVRRRLFRRVLALE